MLTSRNTFGLLISRTCNHWSVASTIFGWTITRLQPSASLELVLMYWAVFILLTTCWADNTARYACLRARLLTRLFWASATALVLVFSLGWLRVLRPASPCRLNSTGRLAGWIITPCLGRECFPLFADLLLVPDCTGFWVSDSRLRLR